MEIDKIIKKDVLEFMETIPDNKIDLIVTDPPYQNQKPIELIKRCIVKHSDVGDTVFDGFMGSGTTALAALETDRHFIGTEIDEYYFGIAEERIKNHNAQLSLFDEV
ncbi:site-specific DNA-methyltransferase [Streptococcus pneumoniae]|uniref:site-specific DNA-methyltransferase n=2 Tax=Streptococcus pneumoniae TaxID=1313 RepID=UPI000776E85B|nr:site-specific DNA-methyltransferase [Streptococcus pneumoniae]KXV98610.1 hypothetical protein NTPn6_02720 [Streptococcus pneumoniae]MBT1061248.1 hypothetical protein [Streptococcus pneumoniae]MDS5426043.1 site-specific DNA-methyltransferase [Streptococcus pneumoniae]NMG52505.1 hypothetical protein [Streptococcus pneumoniae]NMG62890.1 hypothetical protein [Streptococcus pneumoniae]